MRVATRDQGNGTSAAIRYLAWPATYLRTTITGAVAARRLPTAMVSSLNPNTSRTLLSRLSRSDQGCARRRPRPGDFQCLGDSQGKPRILRTSAVTSGTTAQSLHFPVKERHETDESSEDGLAA